MSKKKKEKKKFEVTQEQSFLNAECYAAHTLLYLNDCAANYCLDVCRSVETAGYKGNGAKKICVGLQHRVQEYFDIFNEIFNVALNELAEFNCIYDDKCDDAILNLKNIIREELEPFDIEHKDFIALVETARTMTEYACDMNDYVVKELQKLSEEHLFQPISNWKPVKMLNAINDLSDFVSSVIPDGMEIDLNSSEKLKDAFIAIYDAIFGYTNFKQAFRKTYKNK